MKKLFTTTLFIFSTSLLMAQTPMELNTALKAGTLGYGFDVSTPINKSISARFNLNGLSYTDSQTSDGNDFVGTLDLFTAGALVDYYPFENNFRLSSGLYYNGNGFSGTVTPSSTVTVDINNKEYSAAELGHLDSTVSFNTIAPYLGIGWGNDTHDKGWGFTFDLGVMYHGTPNVDLTAVDVNPTVANEIVQNLAVEEQNANNDLSSYKFYPLLALGVNYSF